MWISACETDVICFGLENWDCKFYQLLGVSTNLWTFIKRRRGGTGSWALPAVRLRFFQVGTELQNSMAVGSPQLRQPAHPKNKMKPTNPNADTYVEEPRQYLFVTFSSEPTFGTPWLDTLRWHSCRTHLLDTIAQRSCKTLLLDTLTWHSCKTLLLDTLVTHACLTPLTWHSYLTLLPWQACKTLLLDTLVRHSYLILL